MKTLGKRVHSGNRMRKHIGFIDDLRELTVTNDLKVIDYDEHYDGLEYQKKCRFHMEAIV